MWLQTIMLLLALSAAGGLLCGALWDVFKIIKAIAGISANASKTIGGFVFVAIFDVVFCLACGCVLSVVFYYGNEGNFRLISLPFFAIGFFVHRITLGALTDKILRLCQRTAEKILKKLDRVLKRSGTDRYKKDNDN